MSSLGSILPQSFYSQFSTPANQASFNGYNSNFNPFGPPSQNYQSGSQVPDNLLGSLLTSLILQLLLPKLLGLLNQNHQSNNNNGNNNNGNNNNQQPDSVPVNTFNRFLKDANKDGFVENGPSGLFFSKSYTQDDIQNEIDTLKANGGSRREIAAGQELLDNFDVFSQDLQPTIAPGGDNNPSGVVTLGRIQAVANLGDGQNVTTDDIFAAQAELDGTGDSSSPNFSYTTQNVQNVIRRAAGSSSGGAASATEQQLQDFLDTVDPSSSDGQIASTLLANIQKIGQETISSGGAQRQDGSSNSSDIFSISTQRIRDLSHVENPIVGQGVSRLVFSSQDVDNADSLPIKYNYYP